MKTRSYHVPPAGHPPQTELLTGRAVFTEAYAVIPKGVIRDIVASYLPHWDGTRVWVLARQLSGFAETFSHYLVELAPGGGRPDACSRAVILGFPRLVFRRLLTEAERERELAYSVLHRQLAP